MLRSSVKFTVTRAKPSRFESHSVVPTNVASEAQAGVRSLQIDDQMLQRVRQRRAGEHLGKGASSSVKQVWKARRALASSRSAPHVPKGIRALGHAHEQGHAIALEGNALDGEPRTVVSFVRVSGSRRGIGLAGLCTAVVVAGFRAITGVGLGIFASRGLGRVSRLGSDGVPDERGEAA